MVAAFSSSELAFAANQSAAESLVAAFHGSG
jgi:hypothetical protein